MTAKKIPVPASNPGREHMPRSGEIACAFPKQSHDTTTPGTLQKKVLSLLHVGEANALTLRDLTRLTEADGRRVRLAIRKARLDGVPVVSGDSGYWISGSPRETRRFTRQMRSRAREILRVARAVESS